MYSVVDSVLVVCFRHSGSKTARPASQNSGSGSAPLGFAHPCEWFSRTSAVPLYRIFREWPQFFDAAYHAFDSTTALYLLRIYIFYNINSSIYECTSFSPFSIHSHATTQQKGKDRTGMICRRSVESCHAYKRVTLSTLLWLLYICFHNSSRYTRTTTASWENTHTFTSVYTYSIYTHRETHIGLPPPLASVHSWML